MKNNYSVSGKAFSSFIGLFFLFNTSHIFSQTIQTITTSTTWLCPSGVTSIQVECWGAGGGGGGATSNVARVGGGGSGGSYVKNISINVAPGTLYIVTIGAGGIAGTKSSTAVDGASGGNTSFSGGTITVITATGGLPGLGGSTTVNPGTGGVGSVSGNTGYSGLFNYPGGSGAAGVASASSGGGGSVASSNGVGVNASGMNGGAATIGGGGDGKSAAGAGINGSSPGGGGGGGFNANAGGTGGNGQVIITYAAAPISTRIITLLGSLSALTTVYGSQSGTTSFTVSGINMGSGILVMPPLGFEVSINSSTGFTSSITVGGLGTIAPTIAYVRLIANNLVGSYSGNIILSSSGASSVTVATLLSTVTAKGLTISGITANNKIYDGNTTATVSGNGLLVGLTSSDIGKVVLGGTAIASFGDGVVGNNKLVSVTGYLLSGSAAGNYLLSQPSGLTANITAAQISYLFKTDYTTDGIVKSWYMSAANCILDTLAGSGVTTGNGTSYDTTEALKYGLKGQSFGTYTQGKGLNADGIAVTDSSNLADGRYFQFKLSPSNFNYSLNVTSISLSAYVFSGTVYGAVNYSTDGINWISTDSKSINETPISTGAGVKLLTDTSTTIPSIFSINGISLNIKSGSYLYIRFVPMRSNAAKSSQTPVITNVIVGGSVNQATTYKSNGNVTTSSAANWLCNCVGNIYAIATLAPTSVNNILVQNNHTLSINTSYTIGQAATLTIAPLGVLIVNSGQTLTTNNNLVLTSDSTGTASIGNSLGNIIGNTTVQRYIPVHSIKGYTLVSAPINAPSIYSAWQENGASVSDFGTQISGAVAGNGFDFASSNGVASMYEFADTTFPRWLGLSNTKTQKLSAGIGYLLWVRGDRKAGASSAVNSKATTLRAMGNIVSGNVVFATNGGTIGTPNLTDGANLFNLIANPYACAIDWTNNTAVVKKNINNSFIVYDPSINVFVTSDGVTVSPSVSHQQPKYIQSGQGFFISNAAVLPQLTITEGAKVTQIASSTDKTTFGLVTPNAQLNVNIYKSVNEQSVFVDGAVAIFSPSYSVKIAEEDAPKFTNFNENVSFIRNGISLSIEGRPIINNTDTLYLQTANLSVNTYRLIIDTKGFASNISAVLIDRFLNTTQSIKLNEANQFAFDVSINAPSNIPNRFIIVLNNKATTLIIADAIPGDFNLNLAPNPVINDLMVSYHLPLLQPTTFSLINAMGKVVRQIIQPAALSGTFTLSMKSLSSGLYSLRLVYGSNVLTKKVIKL